MFINLIVIIFSKHIISRSRVLSFANYITDDVFTSCCFFQPGHFAPRWSTLRWGLCVPAECNDTEVLAGLQHLLQGYQLPGVALDVDIKPGMCYTAQPGYILPFHTIVTL